MHTPRHLSPDLAGQLCDRIAARRRLARYARLHSDDGLSLRHWRNLHARAVALFLGE